MVDILMECCILFLTYKIRVEKQYIFSNNLRNSSCDLSTLNTSSAFWANLYLTWCSVLL